MKPGKVSPQVLESIVYSHLGARRPEVVVRPHVGEDCTVIDFGDWSAVITCDPITGASHRLGWYAVHIACNDLATTGAEPVAVLLTLMLSAGTSEAGLEQIMRDAEEAAATLGAEIAGGHTEVTPGIDRTIAAVTAIGKAPRGQVLSARGAKPGDALLLTKGAAIEGTAILAADLADRLHGRVDGSTLSRARDFIQMISVVPEGRIAARSGASAMHDVTEGGILAGAWELAEAAGIGVELWADEVPVLPDTQAICRALEVDPLALVSSGAMMISAPDSKRTMAALGEAGIPVRAIGIMTPKQRVIVRGGQQFPLTPPERDELWRLMDQSG